MAWKALNISPCWLKHCLEEHHITVADPEGLYRSISARIVGHDLVHRPAGSELAKTTWEPQVGRRTARSAAGLDVKISLWCGGYAQVGGSASSCFKWRKIKSALIGARWCWCHFLWCWNKNGDWNAVFDCWNEGLDYRDYAGLVLSIEYRSISVSQFKFLRVGV